MFYLTTGFKENKGKSRIVFINEEVFAYMIFMIYWNINGAPEAPQMGGWGVE
jgi:hypothetical protein